MVSGSHRYRWAGAWGAEGVSVCRFPSPRACGAGPRQGAAYRFCVPSASFLWVALLDSASCGTSGRFRLLSLSGPIFLLYNRNVNWGHMDRHLEPNDLGLSVCSWEPGLSLSGLPSRGVPGAVIGAH